MANLYKHLYLDTEVSWFTQLIIHATVGSNLEKTQISLQIINHIVKTLRILFWLTLFCGIIILAIGVYLSIICQASDGYTSGRLGNINHGMVNGFSALFLGAFLLVLAIGAHKMYKDEIKRYKKLE